jgi:hypothetical protein
MKRLNLHDLMRREARALLRLSPWIVASLALTLGVLRADLVATSGIFQSPATSTPTTEATATSEVPEATVTAPPTSTYQPTQTPMPTATVTVAPATATPTLMAPTATASVPPTVQSVSPTATVDERQRYADEGTDLIFEWGTLFDSVALGVSYIWLCCGAVIFVLIPFVFIVLWVAGRRRNQQEE